MSKFEKAYYQYKKAKYEYLSKNFEKTIDKSTEVCYNKDTK